ncbi:MAG: DNA polymerase IV [Candidatus Eisenbacteria bacterium]
MADRDRFRFGGKEGNGPSVILHVDMDSFFVSVERSLDPRLRDRPVMVGGTPGGRGVVVACSYDVRKMGVRAGMPAGRAIRLAPGATMLPSRHRLYTQISTGIMIILSRFTDRFEPTSVDEAYLDLSGLPGGCLAAVSVGEEIRRAVREKYGLPASVGIGPSRMIAKIASRMAKPDGIDCIPAERIPCAVFPLPVDAMGGVGEKTAASLRMLGIRTIGDLAAADGGALRRFFGKNGSLLSRLARGEGDFAVVSFREAPDPKSMSNERTLARDSSNPEFLDTTLLWLSEKVAGRLRREEMIGDVFTLKIRFADFRTILRSRTLPEHTNDERTILALARESFARHSGGRPVRLLGVGISNLVRLGAGGGGSIPALDLEPARRRYREALPVFDRVRSRFGEGSLRKASLL